MLIVRTLEDLAGAVTELGCYIFGGVAEDAVLDGTLTRPHSDVDVLIRRSEVESRLEQFASLGYRDWETWLQDTAGRAQVLHGSINGIDLEASIFEDDGDELYFEFTAQDGRVLHYFPPPSMFDYPRVTLDGALVQTISPRGLYDLRAGVAASTAFGEFRAQDAPVQQRLRTELLADVPEVDLEPRLRPA